VRCADAWSRRRGNLDVFYPVTPFFDRNRRFHGRGELRTPFVVRFSCVLMQRRESRFHFTMPEMQRADAILTSVYRKAKAPERYRASFYDGPHKFDRELQKEAFDWFDRWLRS
jgi:hypothetical protein